MTPVTRSLTELISAMQALGVLGWITLAVVAAAAVEAAWKAFTLPLPIRADALSWVAVPAHLPVSGAPNYGHRDLRAAYPAAMARAVGTSSLGLILLVASLAWWLEATRSDIRPKPWKPPHEITLPGPDTRVENVPEILSTGAAALSPELQRLLSGPIRPTKDQSALVDSSLTSFTMDDLALGLYVSPYGDGDGLRPESNSGETVIPTELLPGEEPTMELSVVELVPVLVTLPRPDYPRMARDAGVEGVVRLNLLISATGVVQQVRILESIPALDEAARVSALAARFRPALWQGRPVRVWAALDIRFRLTES